MVSHNISTGSLSTVLVTAPLSDWPYPMAQAAQFLVVVHRRGLDLRVELADHRGDREEAVGVGQQQQ